LQAELEERLKRVKQVFDIAKILSIRPDPISIARYYKVNKSAYVLFHNPNGFVHMGISRDLKYSHDDLLEQPKLVAKYIEQLNARNVLELATGKGASSAYLAKKFPNIKFAGIDLPSGQLDVAKKKARKTSNFFPVEGDYHNLERYPDNHFDVVFVIEGLCYSERKDQVADEVWRVLRNGGIFIVFDGYLGRSESSLNTNEQLAKRLTERGMMVDTFERCEDVKEKILSAGFAVIHEEDVSKFVMPTLRRFEKLARRVVFAHPKMGRFVARLLPNEFTFNAVSAYLMPLLIELGVAKYAVLVVKKRDQL